MTADDLERMGATIIDVVDMVPSMYYRHKFIIEDGAYNSDMPFVRHRVALVVVDESEIA